jgi:nuclear GTP-binding protein
MHLLDTETYTNTFGPKAQRKKPKVNVASIDDLALTASSKLGKSR